MKNQETIDRIRKAIKQVEQSDLPLRDRLGLRRRLNEALEKQYEK